MRRTLDLTGYEVIELKNSSNITEEFQDVVKLCKTCGKHKSLSNFYYDKRYQVGRASECINCKKERSLEAYRKAKEE